ncbi:MAG TPA: fluoride efflux transporter CrcB [Gemmatimonadaceae bacterium]|nr:fluoride efflux transporter CrcB [Gemmatimonadaceae bacterium]
MNERLLLSLYVAVGSAIGGVARWVIGNWIQLRTGAGFPFGTLAVNATGALLLGVIVRLAIGMQSLAPEMRLLLTTGFCGGYTTFSTFSYETAVLLEQGEYGRATTYVLASVFASLLAMFLGFMIARALLVSRGRA